MTQENDNHSLSNGNRPVKCYHRFQVAVIQGDSTEKVNIFGGDSLGHGEKEISYDHLSNFEWLLRHRGARWRSD